METQIEKLKSNSVIVLKIAIAFLFIAWNLNVIAQDTITFRNGNKVIAVVKEISDESIKYKNYSNINGPDYVSEKNDIAFITYKNGMKEIFQEVKPWFKKNKEQDNTSEDQSSSSEVLKIKTPIDNPKDENIECLGGNIYKLDGNYFSQRETFSLMQFKKNEQINMHIKKAKIAKGVKLIGFAAIPLGVVGIGILAEEMFFGSGLNQSQKNISTGLLVGGTACLATSIVLGVKQKTHTQEAIRLYNQNY